MISKCNVRVVSTPFGINGLECYEGGMLLSNHHVLSYAPQTVAGETVTVEGKMREKNGQTATGSDADTLTYLVSMHRKGRLLVWDADTLNLVGMCYHHNCSVIQCTVTNTYLYVRVESEFDCDNDADAKVYVWHTKSLELFRQLVAHDVRVTSLVVSDQDDARFATSGTNNFIHVWDLNVNIMAPVHRIKTQGNAIVSLFFHGFLLGGHADTPLVMWNVETGEETQKLKENGGFVSVLRWLRDPKCIARYPKRSKPHFVSVLIGFNDGYVSEWALDTSSGKVNMLFKWGQRVHRAHINDICGDDDVVLSCSAVDGAFLLSPSCGRLALLVSYGVRACLMDSLTKRVVLGVDNGEVKVFCYDRFAHGEGEPNPIFSFAPHTSGITGLVLELSDNFAWDRLICSAADGNVVFADFTGSRGTRLLKQMGAESVDYIPESGAILISTYHGKTISVLDQQTLAPFSNSSSLKTGQKISVLRWVESTQKLLVGYEGGSLIVFDATITGGRTPSFEFSLERKLVPFSPRSIFLDETTGSMAVVNLQNSSQWNNGAFLIVDTKTADLAFRVHLLLNMFPFRSSLVVFEGSSTYDYTVILQLRDGSIVQYSGNSVSKEDPAFVRVLIPSFISNTCFSGFAEQTPCPSQYILSVMSSADGTPNLMMICPEKGQLKRLFFSPFPGDSPTCSTFEDKSQMVFGSSTKTEEPIVVGLCAILQGDLGFAVLRDSPHVDILSMGGDYLYRISYEGDVVNFSALGSRRRSRNLAIDTALLENDLKLRGISNPFSSVCIADFSSAARYLALGYQDGVVQLFDTTQRVIFSRFSLHSTSVSGLWALPHCVISATSDGVCYGSVIFQRAMFGDEDTKRPTKKPDLLRRAPSVA